MQNMANIELLFIPMRFRRRVKILRLVIPKRALLRFRGTVNRTLGL